MQSNLKTTPFASRVQIKFWIAFFTTSTGALPCIAAEPATKLVIAAVQMRSSKDLEQNIKRTNDFIERCANQGARIVVFPECSVTGDFPDLVVQISSSRLADAEQRIAAACKKHHVYAIVGSPWRENEKLFNSAIMISPEGRVIERYHKMQLAEDWPHPGDHLSAFKMDDVICTTMICHDERYPEIVRLPVLAGAQIVFYISHESGLKNEHKIGPYRAQIQARAVENGVWVVQANAPANEDMSGSHGQSRIINPDGNIVEEASIFGEDIIMATIDVENAGRINATRSLRSDVLRDWWEEGLKRVRIVE